MQYHPEKKEEILAKRTEQELKHRKYYPKQKSANNPQVYRTRLNERLVQIKHMKEEKKSKLSFIDEFLDAEANQKKYGFTTEVVNGIRNIYYDGDMDVLNEAMYGPMVEVNKPALDPSRTIRLSSFDDKLYVRLPNTEDEIPVKVKIGTDDSKSAYFAIVTETSLTLTQLYLTDPAYFPDERACQYVIDMRGLSALNKYVRDNFSGLIQEWNRLHPAHQFDFDIPLPNYRFLASYTYLESKK